MAFTLSGAAAQDRWARALNGPHPGRGRPRRHTDRHGKAEASLCQVLNASALVVISLAGLVGVKAFMMYLIGSAALVDRP